MTAIEVNESLTLTGLPSEAFHNRSALDWMLDRCTVKLVSVLPPQDAV